MAQKISFDNWKEYAMMHPALVVDDEDFKRGQASGVALANGYMCDYASCAIEAWKMLSSKRYEILITDNSMLERDQNNFEKTFGSEYDCGDEGLSLINKIKKEMPESNLEIIMYSGSNRKEEAEKLGAKFIGNELYTLNTILRENGSIYDKPQESYESKKKGFFDRLRK